MTFNTYFKTSSYAMVACGTLALAVSGGMSAGLSVACVITLALTWSLEGTRWQLSERVGLLVVMLSLPLFYLDWKFQLGAGSMEPPRAASISSLTHLILFLSAVKLWQVKADRDWLFLYLISFFEILLAAGLSVSPLFLASLGLYMFSALSTVVCFEIRKARRRLRTPETQFHFAPEETFILRLVKRRRRAPRQRSGEARRLPLVALCLLALIGALALPIFFITPRLSSSALARADGGLSNMIGFSDEVNLGEIGRLMKSDRIVMRVRVDEPQARKNRALRWRGVALDNFNGRAWRRSTNETEYRTAGEHNLFQFGTTQALDRLTVQTFFVEPMDTPALFIAPRAVAVQGALPYVGRDLEGALSTREHSQERISYRAYSDTTEPEPPQLRADAEPYPRTVARYLQPPLRVDPRIVNLTREMLVNAGASNRYDAARVVESYLRNNFGYSLDMKAGGDDPLADFLFRVRAGHCEYFATAMAVMLRTAGVATRVVNGFQMGEYNDAANVYTVRQSDAHSWVEVYFPSTDTWVSFDPTPSVAGANSASSGGLGGRLRKYAEALELFWIQYVVAYDKQEQHSLANAARSQISIYRQTAAQVINELRRQIASLWRRVPAGGQAQGYPRRVNVSQIMLLVAVVGILITLMIGLRRRGWMWGQRLRRSPSHRQGGPAIAFYERMSKALEARGASRATDQTPLEFAAAVGRNEVVQLTRAYNRVRYGAHDLSPTEAARIEEWLQQLESQSSIVNR